MDTTEKVLKDIHENGFLPKRRHIKRFVFALEKVYDKTEEVDMRQAKRGVAGQRCGCHGWLACRALDWLAQPDHKTLGESSRKYSYFNQLGRLTLFLHSGSLAEIENKAPTPTMEFLRKFAEGNPSWWGNEHGVALDCEARAFHLTEEDALRPLLESTLVAWWKVIATKPVPQTKLKLDLSN